MNEPANSPIDSRIKQAKRQGAGAYFFAGIATLAVVGGFLFWLFLVRGFNLLIGPDEAIESAVIEVESGIAWSRNATVYTLGGDVKLRVTAEKFEAATLAISIDSPSNIDVLLMPSPAVLTANIVHSTDTQWYVDEQLVHVGNELNYSVAQGRYEVRADHPYFQPWRDTIEATRGEMIPLNVKLEPFNGEAVINSLPTGAVVTVDDNIIGETPLNVTLKGGEYSLSLNIEGYQTTTEVVSIEYQSQQLNRDYVLKPLQAQLSITTHPAGGVLLVNGVEKQDGEYSLDANSEHFVTYAKQGYFPFEQQITLQPGQQELLNIGLTQENGDVSVVTNVTADLSLNGTAMGTTPFNSSLQAVEQKFVISKPGYRSVVETLVPSSEQATRLNVELLTEFDARRQEGRPLFANQIGIQLARLNGSPFKMGSAPNETGRRRNEHQLNVSFSRPFWVSRHEITEAQYARFSGSASTSNLPVTNVTWLDAAKYTNWLSEQEGLPVFYHIQGNRLTGMNTQSRGYRLPTEAEWEWLAKKAKRGRSTTYVWGNQTRIPTNAGNFGDESVSGNQLIFLQDYNDKNATAAPVGSFKVDRNGFFDLAGNVSEWVHDRYTNTIPDLTDTYTDYLGSQQGSMHVVKGGNYLTGRLRDLRAAYREVGDTPKATIGFRIARYDR